MENQKKLEDTEDDLCGDCDKKDKKSIDCYYCRPNGKGKVKDEAETED